MPDKSGVCFYLLIFGGPFGAFLTSVAARRVKGQDPPLAPNTAPIVNDSASEKSSTAIENTAPIVNASAVDQTSHAVENTAPILSASASSRNSHASEGANIVDGAVQGNIVTGYVKARVVNATGSKHSAAQGKNVSGSHVKASSKDADSCSAPCTCQGLKTFLECFQTEWFGDMKGHCRDFQDQCSSLTIQCTGSSSEVRYTCRQNPVWQNPDVQNAFMNALINTVTTFPGNVLCIAAIVCCGLSCCLKAMGADSDRR